MSDFCHWLSANFVNVLFCRNCVQAASGKISSHGIASFFIPIGRIVWCVLKPWSFGFLFHISINEEKVSHCFCGLRNRETDSCERIESCWLMFAIRANHDRSVLTRHEISNDGLVSLKMSHPALTRKFQFGFILFFNWRDVWFDFNSV